MSNNFNVSDESAGNKINTISASGDVKKKAGFFGYFTYPFSELIGKGDQAKDSVVWYLITRLVRISFFVMFVLLGVDIWYNKGVNCIQIIKDVWAVFVPVITLAMGYLFGKREKDNSEN